MKTTLNLKCNLVLPITLNLMQIIDLKYNKFSFINLLIFFFIIVNMRYYAWYISNVFLFIFYRHYISDVASITTSQLNK